MCFGELWWTQMLNPVRTFNLLKNALSVDKNIFLFCKEPIPWKEILVDKIKKQLGDITAVRSFKMIKADKNSQPGYVVLNSLCPPDVQADYWPDQTYAQYFSELDNITLNSFYVWVEGIDSEDEASKWLAFVNEYRKNSHSHGKGKDRAIFILETVGSFSFETKSEYFVSINMTPNEFDRHMFCMMNTFDINCSYALKQYIAELAFNLSTDNIELCGSLAKSGDDLLSSPHKTYNLCCDSMGITEEKGRKENSRIDRDIIVSQMRTVFPMLEQRRYMFIEKYVNEIKKVLPVSNSIDELVTEPFELELSTLLYIVNQNLIIISDEDRNNLKICREIRNKLAHNERVSGREIKKLYGMYI